MSIKRIAPHLGEGDRVAPILAETKKNQQAQPTDSSALPASLSVLICDRAMSQMQDAVDAMEWIATLHSVIRETAAAAEAGSDGTNTAEGNALRRIGVLASIAGFIADSVGNDMDCAREGLKSEHLPRLLAALPNGGEA